MSSYWKKLRKDVLFDLHFATDVFAVDDLLLHLLIS